MTLGAGCGSGNHRATAAGTSGTTAQRPVATAPAATKQATAPSPHKAQRRHTAPSASTPAASKTSPGANPKRPPSGIGASLGAACQRARRAHPLPPRPGDAGELKAYAAAALPATQATFDGLQKIGSRAPRASALTSAYGALLSLYRQLAAAPAAQAKQIGIGLDTVETVVARQAEAVGAPACAPPAA